MAKVGNYLELAISEVQLYERQLRSCMEMGDKEGAREVRTLFEEELLELYDAFRLEYSDRPDLYGSFWDFITELQNTPLNYEKSLKELIIRSPWFGEE